MKKFQIRSKKKRTRIMTLVTLLSKEVKSKPGFDFIRRGVTRNQASIHPTGRSHVAHHQNSDSNQLSNSGKSVEVVDWCAWSVWVGFLSRVGACGFEGTFCFPPARPTKCLLEEFI